MVGIVVVSHSRALARAAVALAEEMTPGRPVPIAVAAGLDEQTLGTDAVAIGAAIAAVDGPAGVVVLMDLGSAVLSAELALELADDETRARVLLCPAPLVEGLVAAVVTAASGAGRAEVAAEACNGLLGKESQLTDARGPVPGPVAPVSGPLFLEDAHRLTERFAIASAHGLHARPAARLVAVLREAPAPVELRNATTGSAWVSGASLTRITTLGLLTGHELEARATGPQARAALDLVKALAARDFDEPAGAGAETVAPVGGPALPASPGIAIGPIRHHAPGPTLETEAPTNVHKQEPHHERRTLETALTTTRSRVQAIKDRVKNQVSPDDAAVFDAHLALLDDPALLDAAFARIADGAPAAPAWAEATLEIVRRFGDLGDEYLAARAADVRAVGEQVLAELLPTAVEKTVRKGVLVVGDLTPAEAATLDPDVVQGVVTAFGSPTGHAAILTRARGIPSVVGAGPGLLDLAEGTVLALDGTTGELVTTPSPETVAAFERRAEQARQVSETALRATHRPAVTRDGTRILVAANASTPAEATTARANGADLIGLVRTEFLFLGRDHAPDVDEQESAYLDLADAFGGERITLRTLDVGGDKPLSYLPMPVEANPFLGVRGLRLGLLRTELLTAQLRAIVRTARQTPVNVMFPMVTTLDELLTAKTLLDEAVRAEGRPPGLRTGIMVEVPAAALRAAALAPHVDFLSIGTNDLTQYTLAAERGNPAVAALGDPFDPAVLQLIRATAAGAAGRAGVAVCGELAADPRATPLLLGLGVTELSVTPRSVPEIKQRVRDSTIGAGRTLAAQALTADCSAAVRSLSTATE